MGLSDRKVIHFIQKSLFNGKQPTNEGYYVFSRKELAEGAGISVSTLDNCKEDVIRYFSSWCDLKTWANYEEYAGQILYTDVSYEKGKLRFKRNPITLQPPLSHLWALPPLDSYFSYDAFDKKHRRRSNASRIVYDAIPWSWDADLWEQIIEDGQAERINAIISSPPESLLLQQAKSTYSLVDVVLLLEGYKPANLAKVLYRAVGAMLPELCEFLLSHGADPNEIVQQGYSSMHCIAGMDRKGDAWEKVVKLLIDAGGDLTWGNFNVASFAGDVFSKGSDELCRYYIDALQRQGLLSVVSVTNQTPLSILKIYKGSDSALTAYMENLLQNNAGSPGGTI